MTQKDYEQAVITKVQKCIDLARAVMPKGCFWQKDAEFPVPVVKFFDKGRRAGLARRTAQNELIVEFNREACEKHLDIMLNEVIPHEVAHIICFVNPELGWGHDAGWKRVCRALGGSGERCHTLSLTPAKKVRTWLYEDTAGKIREVTTRLHNKMRRHGVRYRYRDNGGLIEAARFIGTNHKPKEEKKMSNENQTVANEAATNETATNETVEAKPSQDRYRKTAGVPSKAERTREIIRELGTEDRKAVIGAIQERLGFTRAMARHYFYCESKKVQ